MGKWFVDRCLRPKFSYTAKLVESVEGVTEVAGIEKE